MNKFDNSKLYTSEELLRFIAIMLDSIDSEVKVIMKKLNKIERKKE